MGRPSVKKNFAYQMVYEVLILILPFVTSPYIARVIGPEGLGIYSYTSSIAYYFLIFSMLGIANYGNRTIAQNRDDKDDLNRVFSNLTAVHIAIAIICSLAYVCYALTIQENKIYAIIQIVYVMSGIFDISWFYFGMEKFRITVIRSGLIKIVSAASIFIFVQQQGDLWKYCLILSLGSLISQLTLWLPLKKYVHFITPQWSEMKQHIKPMLILFIPIIAISMYKFMDKVMIGSISTKTQLGYYENADKAISIPLSVITAFGSVMLPKMSNLAKSENAEKSKQYIAISMQFIMCLALALSFGMASVSKNFAVLFWGEKFAVSGDLIRLLSITIPFIAFANVIRTQFLIPRKEDRAYIVSVCVGAVVNLCINSLLIPKYNATGAAIGTIMAEMSVCFVQSIYVCKELPLAAYFRSFVAFIFGGIIMYLCIWFMVSSMKVSVVSLLIQVLIGGLLYAIFALVYFMVTKNVYFKSILDSFLSRFKKK